MGFPFFKSGLMGNFKGVIDIMKIIVNLFLIPVFVGLTFCITSNIDSSLADSSKSTNYQELKKDGRLYVFVSPEHMASFEQSGEVGKSIIKIGHGPYGETVVFDSDEAVIEFESRKIRQKLASIAYQEFEKDGRIYVFTSPERMASFEKSGEMGKDYIAKIGYSSNSKTVMFDSHDAVKEYDRRHEVTTGAAFERNYYYREIEKNGRMYVFISPERMESFKQTGELGKGIIKVGYGPDGETVIFGSDEAVQYYERRNIR